MTEINRLRKENRLTIPQFAEALGVSVSYATKLLYNDRKVTMNVLQRIKNAFPDVDVSRFV